MPESSIYGLSLFKRWNSLNLKEKSFYPDIGAPVQALEALQHEERDGQHDRCL
jgi:hypothetical protein